MTWWKSRRLHYLLANTALFFVLMVALRAVFYAFFSEVSSTMPADSADVLHALGVGVRFDLRLAMLLVLPLLVLAYFPKFNVMRTPSLRWLARSYILLALLFLVLAYFVDFGHYNYLGERLNITALRFVEDTAISLQMLWESYPVVWITLAWLGLAGLFLFLAWRLERATLNRTATRISKGQAALGTVLCIVVVFFAGLGRVSNINIENPVPLRWSDAFISGNQAVGALGLNPVLFFYATSLIPSEPYDEEAVAQYYSAMADFLAIPENQRGDLNFDRHVRVQPHKLNYDQPPNVVFVMLESLGASRVGAYGTPYNPTPNLDKIAEKSWFFEHFYVPVTGTAKTIWAVLTGTPDVAPEETASRNPLISHQRMLLNELEDYRKFYFVGGSAGWANLKGLIEQSIDGLELYEEGDWQAPNVDVWGISDLSLFRESNQILEDVPNDQPFFAFIQTAGNHRPFTIPKEDSDFQARDDISAEKLAANGFRSLAQYNAVRLLDYNVGEYMKMARESDYFDNTLFVFFGDHNNRITTIPHMPKFQETTGLESHHVPHMIYAPKYLQPKQIDKAVSLVDVMPTMLGMLGKEYTNTTLGRDIQRPAAEGDRGAFVVLREGPAPTIGVTTQDFLVRMQHDGSGATLHKLYSDTPMDDRQNDFPAEFDTLGTLTQGIYESARYLFYDNVDSGEKNGTQ